MTRAWQLGGLLALLLLAALLVGCGDETPEPPQPSVTQQDGADQDEAQPSAEAVEEAEDVEDVEVEQEAEAVQQVEEEQQAEDVQDAQQSQEAEQADEVEEAQEDQQEEAVRGDTVSLLRASADAFEYEIGEFGGELTFATISEPLTFNLALANDAGSSGVLGYLFEGLTDISWLSGEPEPNLAESWDVSADGLAWTFYLRRDVRWHDGEPFTARDVEFTFNQIIYNADIPTSTRAAFNFRLLDENGEWQVAPMTVEAIDDYTVQFVLPVSFAPFLRSMATAIYPQHILQPYVDAGTFNEVWDLSTDPSEIIGTGPFLIDQYIAGERVVFRRNPDYWRTDAEGNHLPYLDRIVQVVVPDLESELEAFRGGVADVHGVLGREFADLEPLQEEENFTIHRRGPNFGSTFLAFNQNQGVNPATGEAYLSEEKLYWFGNLEFRRAVAHVVDKDAIIEQVQHGLGYPQWSPISPAAGGFHNPDVATYEYDLARASAILDELGWTDGDGDGFREDDRGNAIAFVMATNEGNEVREQVTEIIHQGMTEIGLNVDFQVVDFGVLVGQLTASYDWDAIVIGFTGGPDPYGGIVLWHSSENLHLWYPNQDEPATDWEAELDDLYVRASQELDRELRFGLYHRAQEIVAENLPLIYTSHAERLTAVRNVFGNTTPTLYGIWDVRYVYRTD
ncbi:MAG: ABC transporter substrate-binding protein [Chloroflexota bacterium]|nr:ABC transporter substrate-binding protein [Chloroflexota bacterium]